MDRFREAEPAQHIAEGRTGCAPGIADQADPEALIAEGLQRFRCAVDHRGRKLYGGQGVDRLERIEILRIERRRIELQCFEKMLDLDAAGDVLIARPVQLLASVPEGAVGFFDPLSGDAPAAIDEDLLHAIEADPLLLPRHLRGVGNEGFPQIEGDGFQHAGRRLLQRDAAAKAFLVPMKVLQRLFRIVPAVVATAIIEVDEP